jgi:hypothetical protein
MEEVKEATEGSKTSEVLSPAANIDTVKNQKVPAVTLKLQGKRLKPKLGPQSLQR